MSAILDTTWERREPGDGLYDTVRVVAFNHLSLADGTPHVELVVIPLKEHGSPVSADPDAFMEDYVPIPDERPDPVAQEIAQRLAAVEARQAEHRPRTRTAETVAPPSAPEPPKPWAGTLPSPDSPEGA